MIKAFYIILLASIFVLFGHAQTVIWSEDFTNTDGSTMDPDGQWTSSCSGCTFSDVNDYFEVRNNFFRGEDMDGQGVWLSRWIDISPYSNVSASIILFELATPDANDSISASYSTDGGATWTYMSLGSYYDDFNGQIAASAQDINADSIQLRVLMYTDGNDDEYGFDDALIVEPALNQPGSGYTLDFDDAGSANTADVVELDDSFPNLVEIDFTVTAWIKSDNVGSSGQRVFCNDEYNTSNGYALSLGDPGSGRLRFYMRGGNPVSLDVTNSNYYLSSNTWTHVAMTHSASANRKRIYVDGVLAASATYTNNPSGAADGRAAIGGEGIQSSESANHFNGEIDEVTIWQDELTATEIRDLMCRKLTGSETDLLAYYRFDDGVGYTVRDETGSYPAGMVNMDPSTDWVTSSAPIGNSSSYAYNVGTWGGVQLYHISSDGDSLSVSNVTGNPECVHIYNVSQSPNSSTGYTGVGGNAQYWGVHHGFGTSTTYTATHFYRENDAFEAGGTETDLLLFVRDNNADNSWSDGGAVLNTSNKTLTLTALNTEFILGSSSVTLPIFLLRFSAVAEEDGNRIQWSTAVQINVERFEVLRSFDLEDWEVLETIDAEGFSSVQNDYHILDPITSEGWIYYTLRSIDFDGYTESFNILPLHRKASMGDMHVFPNPVRSELNLRGFTGEVNCSLVNAQGNTVFNHQVSEYSTLPLIDLPPGIYTAVFVDSEGRTFVSKLVKMVETVRF